MYDLIDKIMVEAKKKNPNASQDEIKMMSTDKLRKVLDKPNDKSPISIEGYYDDVPTQESLQQ